MIDIDLIPNDNTTKCIPDVIVSHVSIPTPVLPPVTMYDNANAFTFAMRQSLAQCINLQRIPLRLTIPGVVSQLLIIMILCVQM